MDSDRFDLLVRDLAAAPSRRGIARALAGLPLAGGLRTLLDLAGVEARKGERKKKPKKCGPCRVKKKGKCKGKKPDGTECGSACLACVSGVCTAKTDEACGEGQVCLPNGSCAQTCTSNPECPELCFCNGKQFNPDQPQICMQLPTGFNNEPCSGPDDCPVGQGCYVGYDFVNRCYDVCTT